MSFRGHNLANSGYLNTQSEYESTITKTTATIDQRFATTRQCASRSIDSRGYNRNEEKPFLGQKRHLSKLKDQYDSYCSGRVETTEPRHIEKNLHNGWTNGYYNENCQNSIEIPTYEETKYFPHTEKFHSNTNNDYPGGGVYGYNTEYGHESQTWNDPETTTWYRPSVEQQSYESIYPASQGMEVPDIFSLTRHNRYRNVELLLDKGVDVNVRDKHGNSLLIVACQNGLKRIAKLALRRGADINLQNYNGNTALHYCFGLSYGETLGKYLISKGADPDITNRMGMRGFEGFSD